MSKDDLNLDFTEQVIFALRSLYNRYGYTQYKMSKFEEYDLYAKNKDFLISDRVITFTDLNGKLMALKPDVTLSIVKNSTDRPAGLRKLWYNENVYRVSKGSRSFRELMQVGLEAMGAVDSYCILEVLQLAARSLLAIGENVILDVSHLGLLTELMKNLGIPQAETGRVLRFIGEKNRHELTAACPSSPGLPPCPATLPQSCPRRKNCSGAGSAAICWTLFSVSFPLWPKAMPAGWYTWIFPWWMTFITITASCSRASSRVCPPLFSPAVSTIS